MTILATPTVASVSLLDSERDPEAFARELGDSFERYGFAGGYSFTLVYSPGACRS